jgi:antitoxin (DNA-binding transcriptional repressor) of toxin-antitoxin stability system
MSHTMPIEQAGAHLAELVGQLRPGEEIVLTQDQRPVAKVVSSRQGRLRRQPGNCKGMLVIRQEDEEHLDDFGEYMP